MSAGTPSGYDFIQIRSMPYSRLVADEPGSAGHAMAEKFNPAYVLGRGWFQGIEELERPLVDPEGAIEPRRQRGDHVDRFGIVSSIQLYSISSTPAARAS